jgi:hypothetical protein
MGWTLATARAQPYEELLLLAADFLLEAEDVPLPPSGGAGPAPPAAPGRERKKRTVRYEAA